MLPALKALPLIIGIKINILPKAHIYGQQVIKVESKGIMVALSL